MLDTKIITQNGSNKQHQFEQAFIPQTNNKITPEQTLKFVAEKCLFYHLEVERLKAELEKAETLARLHGTWLLELDRQQVTK